MLAENALKHNVNTRESPLRIDIRVENDCVTVTNNLQLRNAVCKNRKGLENLKKQYLIQGKNVDVRNTGTEFAVVLPLLQTDGEAGG